jgi:urease accessory protein
MAGAAPLARFLSALQLSDSAFPSGRYTLSHGLEGFAQDGLLDVPCPPGKLGALLSGCVRFGVAPSDGVALACAHRAVTQEGTIDLDLAVPADRRLGAVKLAREVREASARTGRALLAIAEAFAGLGLSDFARLVETGETPGNHAVVLGLVDALLGVPRLEAVAGELYAFSAGWVAAAVRLGLTDHRTAQSLLHRARPVLAAAAQQASAGDVVDICSCSLLPDVVSMRHECAEVRLFAT